MTEQPDNEETVDGLRQQLAASRAEVERLRHLESTQDDLLRHQVEVAIPHLTKQLATEVEKNVSLTERAELAEADNAALLQDLMKISEQFLPGTTPVIADVNHPGLALLDELRRLRELLTACRAEKKSSQEMWDFLGREKIDIVRFEPLQAAQENARRAKWKALEEIEAHKSAEAGKGEG